MFVLKLIFKQVKIRSLKVECKGTNDIKTGGRPFNLKKKEKLIKLKILRFQDFNWFQRYYFEKMFLMTWLLGNFCLGNLRNLMENDKLQDSRFPSNFSSKVFSVFYGCSILKVNKALAEAFIIRFYWYLITIKDYKIDSLWFFMSLFKRLSKSIKCLLNGC